MSNKLLRYYNQELSFLREQGAAFAKAHPKIATRLNLGPGEVEDPFVARLLEGVAFLTARIQYKQDEGLQTITDSLLRILYPHYTLPIPSFAVTQFKPCDGLDKSHVIQKISKLIITSPTGADCTFRTCYPVEVQPLEIENIILKSDVNIKANISKNGNSIQPAADIKSCLSITIKTTNDIPLHLQQPKKIRFFISGETRFANLCYELLGNHVNHIQMTTQSYQQDGIDLLDDAIQFVGFSDDENLLPYPAHSFRGYRLLTEFFHFPEKFLFFELILPEFTEKYNSTFCLHLFLDRTESDLEKQMNKNFLALHCTPIINLFEHEGCPINLNHEVTEYHLLPENHVSQPDIEIYQVESINVCSSNSKVDISCLPYFGRKFDMLNQENRLYWFPVTKECWELGNYDLDGTETFVSFSELHSELHSNSHSNLHPELESNYQTTDNQLTLTPALLCTNRTAADHLSVAGKNLRFELSDTDGKIFKEICCQTNITKTRYRQNRDRAKNSNIDLLSHLTLNQICFDSPQSTLNVLKELLSLYNYDNQNDDPMINKGLISATTKRVTQRHPTHLKQGFCQGIEIALTVDEEYFPSNNIFLFGSIINAFLRKACSINSFTKLALKSKQRGDIHTWKPQLGLKTTI